jgi:hypothetical protein
VSAGLISSVRVFCTPEQAAAAQCPDTNNIDVKWLQISAPISQGSSGGPLFNQFGDVVGVTSGIIDGGQSINIAVPANYVKTLLAHPRQIAMAQFATDTREAEEAGGTDEDEDEDDGRVVRKDPGLTDAVFDGCAERDVFALVHDVEQTIERGAPLYNTKTDQGIEACFHIYEGTALQWKLESTCKGVSVAFDSGLKRAKRLKTFDQKAWAIRDTFDGLMIAAKLWADKHGLGAPNPAGAPATSPAAPRTDAPAPR